MAQSAEDLSKRTEQQVSSLEETAAAVEEITATVRSSAERAKDTDLCEGKRHTGRPALRTVRIWLGDKSRWLHLTWRASRSGQHPVARIAIAVRQIVAGD